MSTRPTLRSCLCLTLATAACYSPNSAGTDDGPDEESETSAAVPMTSPSTTTEGAVTTESSEAGESTTAAPGTGDESTGEPPAPFCGDGEVGPEEACDEGDANALTGACRPDCTVATCGDGDIWAGVEGCDDGARDNVFELGACAPDCSRVIESRTITSGELIVNGDFGPTPVAFADVHCPPGTLAMFVQSGVREAALAPYDASGSIDWVLHPFTAYMKNVGDLVWMTDSVPLLGVRDGAQERLAADLVVCDGLCTAQRSVTGLEEGWTTKVDDTCEQWSSDDGAESLAVGVMTADDSRSFAGVGTQPCDAPEFVRPYCVEQ